ncbi:MAG: hypothetical protein OXC98_10785 [bacterium]|nr:hypothetical protein [Acidimicrobiia bacterium]MCY4650834.1 hypothetical protein [bacterium]
MARSARSVAAALVVVLWAGCSGADGQKETTEGHLSHRDVECREAIGVVEEPGPNYRVHGSGDGFVALPAGEMQLGRWGSAGSGSEDHRFSKFGLHVRRSRQVSLEIVTAPDEASLDFGWSGPTPVDALTAGPCGSDSGDWVVWAGGIWVNEPGCVELVATSDEEEISVWLAVGTSCDGVPAKS